MADREFPPGLRTLGIFLIIFGFLYNFAVNLQFHQLVDLTPSLLFMLFGVGILSLINWIRALINIVAVIILILFSIGAVQSLFSHPPIEVIVLTLIGGVFFIALAVLLMVYLNRPYIKELFKNRQERTSPSALWCFIFAIAGFFALSVEEFEKTPLLVQNLILGIILFLSLCSIIIFITYRIKVKELGQRNKPLFLTGAILSVINLMLGLWFILTIK